MIKDTGVILKMLNNNVPLKKTKLNAADVNVKVDLSDVFGVKKGIKNIPIRILELERSEFFNSGNHYESDYYITFTWLVPEDNLQKAKIEAV